MRKLLLYSLASLFIAEAAGDVPASQIIDTVQLEESNCNSNYISHYNPREFTYEEAQMLMRIAQAEAGNQGIEGMELVMAVVLNRVSSDDFPSTIEEVIYQPHHFSSVDDDRYYNVPISREAHLVLANIESGIPIDENIVAFEMTLNNRKLEKYFDYSYTAGDHDFYVKKAASGSR